MCARIHATRHYFRGLRGNRRLPESLLTRLAVQRILNVSGISANLAEKREAEQIAAKTAHDMCCDVDDAMIIVRYQSDEVPPDVPGGQHPDRYRNGAENDDEELVTLDLRVCEQRIRTSRPH